MTEAAQPDAATPPDATAKPGTHDPVKLTAYFLHQLRQFPEVPPSLPPSLDDPKIDEMLYPFDDNEGRGAIRINHATPPALNTMYLHTPGKLTATLNEPRIDVLCTEILEKTKKEHLKLDDPALAPQRDELKTLMMPFIQKTLAASADYKALCALWGNESVEPHVDVYVEGGNMLRNPMVAVLMHFDIASARAEALEPQKMLENATTEQTRLAGMVGRSIRTRVGVTADDITRHTAQMNDDGLSQFMSALMLAVAVRKHPKDLDAARNLARRCMQSMGPKIEMLDRDLARMNRVMMEQRLGIVDSDLVKALTSDAFKNNDKKEWKTMETDPAIMAALALQILGEEGIEHQLPPTLHAAALGSLKALNAGKVHGLPALGTSELPALPAPANDVPLPPPPPPVVDIKPNDVVPDKDSKSKILGEG